MGAAGDMLSAALFELLDETDKTAFISKMNNLGIPGIVWSAEPSVKCGIRGTHVTVLVNGEEEAEPHEHGCEHDHAPDHDHDHDHDHEHEHDHEHHHSSMHNISHIVEDLDIPQVVKARIISVYSVIADAESTVHGVPVDEIHFHEVGTMDAVADITAVCLLMDMLSPDQVIVSPVHVGSGTVRCAHGILPVPAPATALILKGVPIYSGQIRGELCTPTGAALLKTFACSFGQMPVMSVSSVGYGMGRKDFEQANCVRTFLGETASEGDSITELSFNVDDMTAEMIGFAMEILLGAGALEVFTVPIGMKKSRPGIMMCVFCNNADKEKMVRIIFRHTSTIGIRENSYSRYKLDRHLEVQDTPYGQIRRKVSAGYGTVRTKYEFDDLARAARDSEQSISEILDEIRSN